MVPPAATPSASTHKEHAASGVKGAPEELLSESLQVPLEGLLVLRRRRWRFARSLRWWRAFAAEPQTLSTTSTQCAPQARVKGYLKSYMTYYNKCASASPLGDPSPVSGSQLLLALKPGMVVGLPL